MSSTTPAQKNRRRRRLAAIIVVGSLTVAGLATGSLAVFTDNADTTQNNFTAGTIDLSLTEGATYALFSSTDVKPGDYITADGNDAAGDWIKLLVNNDGVNELRYAMTSTVSDNAGTGNLEDQLLVKVALTTVPGSCAQANLGTVLYGGASGRRSRAWPSATVRSARTAATRSSPQARPRRSASGRTCPSMPRAGPGRTSPSRTRTTRFRVTWST